VSGRVEDWKRKQHWHRARAESNSETQRRGPPREGALLEDWRGDSVSD